jgi:hypothetical protein
MQKGNIQLDLDYNPLYQNVTDYFKRVDVYIQLIDLKILR